MSDLVQVGGKMSSPGFGMVVTYHHLLDAGYCQLPVLTYCSVPRHDGSGYTTNPHTYLVRGSLAASIPWPQAAAVEI